MDTPIDNSNWYHISGILKSRTVWVWARLVFLHVQSLPAHQWHKSLS